MLVLSAATALGSPTAWVAGADVDATGATSPMLDVSGLTASGMTFSNVFMSMSVLSTTSDLDQVGAISWPCG